MSLRIGVDIDDVTAEFIPALLGRYNIAYHDDRTPEDIRGWDLPSYVKPECGRRIWDLYTPDIYDREVKPVAGAFQAIEQLRRLGRVFFVSSCGSRDFAQAKLDWLVRYGFLALNETWRFIPVFGGALKAAVPVDVLCDDHVPNVETFPGFAFLINRPHNWGTKTSRHRVNHLGETLPYLRPLARCEVCAEVNVPYPPL